ncbi:MULTISPECIES: carboxymuconolactone decarboxylase family protein [Amycolatopsis]|uniref:4-carboxymuconolactone decarboxylase n=3 Tax=Amycolatopsis TaxID=1813 RepID=A0A1I3L4F9_9PSEU|nr:carboxymuconolactone decarboxylase family protein [Amycolatopsis sacchari]SFI79593.1 4-carboxymuconolactone decarboxylase [Amycolatopsis sacchari]
MIRDEHFELGRELRRRMFGRAGADDQIESTTELDDKLQDIVTRHVFGDIWQRPELDVRTRSMITLAMLVALGRAHEIRIHLRGALANGVTPEEIREIMLHSTIYCGLPAGVDGILAAGEVFAEQGVDTGSAA